MRQCGRLICQRRGLQVMNVRSRGTPARRLLGRLVAVLVLAAIVPGSRPALAYPADAVYLEGRGWGHGRGMGQYGALGYALDHGWGYQQILDHFYGGTSAGSISDRSIRVNLTRFDGRPSVVQQERGHLVTNAAPGNFGALQATNRGDGTFLVEQAPTCAGPWEVLVESIGGPVVFAPFVQNNEREEMLQVCEPEGSSRWLRGTIEALLDSQSVQHTVNDLNIEDYLRGVVPRESPASWGTLGGGAGMEALRSQAVAARSYAASENRYPFAHTCDTTACQVYAGRAVQDAGGFRDLEHPLTDQAIAETQFEVRYLNGQVARTEFSSSTGGWSAGGTFPPVPDEGDDISLNPNHVWFTSVPVGGVEAAWPEIGGLLDVVVTRRNGLGDLGGRVLEVRLEGTSSAVTITGNTFRSRLGLKSDWFSVLGRGWYPLGGVLSSEPDASSWGEGRLDVFVQGTDNGLWHRWHDGAWSDWEPLGGLLTAGPGSVSWAPGRIDVFVRGGDNQLWHLFYDGAWSGWEELGGVLSSGADSAAWGPERLDVFVRGTDGRLWHKWYDRAWSEWEPLGGVLASDPGVVSRGPGQLDVFVKGTDGQLWHKWYDRAWSEWEPLGGVLAGAPDAASWSGDRLDVVVVGPDGQLWHKWWAGATWHEWEPLEAPATGAGSGLTSDPSAVSWGPGRIDVFGRGRDAGLWHKRWDGSSWF
jgi:peptidoglycan hydrolase-like amidase